MITDKTILKDWFSTGLKPDQEQFWAWMDSYYHKNDLLSINAVEGLKNVLENKAEASSLLYLANKDASDLSPGDIVSWKNILGVDELPENVATNDSEDETGNSVSGTSYTKEQSDSKYYGKVSSQYFNSNYVLLADGTPKAAGDFGKNTANSNLTSVTGAGLTLGADWEMKISGKNYTISGLADVSNDSVFNTFITQNPAGKVGKSNGKQPFLNMPALLSDAEKAAWKTNMNGGWTTNTMSVAAITPPVIDKQDKNYWISLRGANLNLPPTSFSIDIMAADGVSKIATIPNSQVQLYQNGLDLMFYYNFKNLAIGEYKIRLWNGVAYYVTSLTIKIVSALNAINLNNLTWETKLFTPNTPNVITVSGGSMSYNARAANKPFARENFIVAALKSSEFVAAGQNFIMSGTMRLNDAAVSLMSIVLGLINTNNTLALTNNAHFQISINSNNIANYSKTIVGDTLFAVVTPNDQPTINWSIARNGNLFIVYIQYGSYINMSSRTGIEDALSLVSYINNTTNNDTTGADAGFNIQSAYTF